MNDDVFTTIADLARDGAAHPALRRGYLETIRQVVEVELAEPLPDLSPDEISSITAKARAALGDGVTRDPAAAHARRGGV